MNNTTFFKPNTYLFKFFNEKKIKTDSFTFNDSEGTFNYMPLSVVLEAISLSTSAERKSIEDMLRRIDFVNGDVADFLLHLAKGLREQQLKSFDR